MTEEQKEAAPEPKKRKSRFWRIFKYLCLFLLLTIGCVFGGAWWICQTSSGQGWLVKTVNSLLEPGENKPGYKIVSLSGSLPFNFKAGLEAYDIHGLWLKAEEFAFVLDWKKLPSLVDIPLIRLKNVDLLRLPEFPPSPEPEEPEKPFELKDINELAKTAYDFLRDRPSWLPDVEIGDLSIENLRLPADLAPQKEPRELALNAGLNAAFREGALNAALNTSLANADGAPLDFSGFAFDNLTAKLDVFLEPDGANLGAKAALTANLKNPELNVKDIPAKYLGDSVALALSLEAEAVDAGMSPRFVAKIAGPDLKAGPVNLASAADWQSGEGWRNGKIDGPTSLKLNLDVEPAPDAPKDSFLTMLQAPVRLALAAKGNLPHVSLNLDLACKEIARDKYAIHNLDINLASDDIAIPLGGNIDELLDRENGVKFKISGLYDKKPIDIASLIFFKRTSPRTPNLAPGWDAGLRNLVINALGASGKGDLRASIEPDRDPSLSGDIDIGIDDWGALALFLPDYKISGNLKLDLALDPSGGAQNATVALSIPALEIRQPSGTPIVLKNIKSDVKVFDLFGKLAFDASLDAGGIDAEGMKLDATLKARGPLEGPLQINLNTGGDIKTRLDARWEPGAAYLNALNLEARLPGMTKIPLGLRSNQPAKILYGKEGISVQNLDVVLSPTGRLRASGGMAPEKLDFSLSLADFNFKPWQALVPSLPAGSASINANLKGTPTRPHGDFLLDLKKIVVPGAALAPVSMQLKGDIVNSGAASALKANLVLDPATLKALGGSVANVAASVPLRFGADGVPSLEMTKPFSAKIRWDGALGPIWNLLPIPDRRLNGRIGVNIEAGGSIKSPSVKGFASVEKARYEDIALGILLTDINLKLDLTESGPLKKGSGGIPGGFNLALSASDGHKGTIAVKGKGGLMGEDLDIAAKIARLKPLRRRDIHIELSGDAKVKGDATAPVVNGEIIVNQGEVLLDNLDFAGSVTTLPISTPESIKAAKEKAAAAAKNLENPSPPKGSGSLNVKINMLPRFVVEGRGLTSIWKANLLVGGTPTDPRITGNISSVKGNFDFLGKNFALTKGIVFFGGGAISNPLLDIELTNETPELTAHIIVTGPVSKIKLTLTSDPSLPRDEILAQVLFGKNMSELSRLEALQLAGAVAQLAGFGSGAGGILSMAKKTLGVDVLRLGTTSEAAGQPGEETASGTTIEMGKYINNMIYMGVQQGMKADSTAFIIQLELTPRTSLEVRTEQNNTWGGIKWKYNY